MAAEDVAELGEEFRDQFGAVEAGPALLVVEDGLSRVSGTAASHAASAQQVAAAAEEQSAATEEMSAASAQLLDAADRMKELVSGLKV